MWVENGVRTAVDDVGREVAMVATAPGGSGRRLEVAWAKLVAELSLGPPPELRTCPSCGSEGMRAATRCGTCWKPLTPLPDAAPPARPSP